MKWRTSILAICLLACALPVNAGAEFFHQLFDQEGIPNTLQSCVPGRANLYAVLKGDGSLRPLVLLNHTEVVRAELRNWSAPPFSGRILNGEIYGRGTVDMKDEGLPQAMMTLIAAREKLPLERALTFLAAADEEVGNPGSAWILEQHHELVRGAEYLITEGGSNLIYADRGTVYGVGVGEKAPFWIRMIATGVARARLPAHHQLRRSSPGQGRTARGGLGGSHPPAARCGAIFPPNGQA